MSALIPPPSTEPPHIVFSDIHETYMFNDIYQLDCDMYIAAEEAQSGDPITTDNYKQAGLVRDDFITTYAQYEILKNEPPGSDGNNMYLYINRSMSENECGYIFFTLNQDAEIDENNGGPAINTENGLECFFGGGEAGVENWNNCQAAFDEYYADYARPA